MSKRIISLLLLLVMLVSCVSVLPITGAAASSETYMLTYNGATYVVPAKTKAPGSMVIDGKTVVGWKYGTTTVAVGADMTLTEDTTLTPITIDGPKTNACTDFKLAEYKGDGTPSELAMRFTATLSRSDYATLKSLGNVRLGMLVTPAKYVYMAGEFTKEALHKLNTTSPYVDVPIDGYYQATETDYVLAASIKSFSQATLKKNPAFAATLYVTVTTEEGHSFTVYGDFDATKTQGVLDLASDISENAQSDLTDQQRGWLQNLLSVFEEKGAKKNDGGVLVNIDINTVTFPFLQAVVAKDAPTKADFYPFVDQYADTQVTDLLFCTFNQVSMTPSEKWTDVLDNYDPETDPLKPTNYSKLYQYDVLYNTLGMDPYAIWFERCWEVGITPWLSIRPNDVHGHALSDEESWLRSEEHKLAQANGWNVGAGHDNFYDDLQKDALDYGEEEIRTRMLAYIEEQLMRYDIGGFELDFSREWVCFDYLNNPDCYLIMNDFLRDVNEIVDRAAEKHGHEIKIHIRLMRDIAQNKIYGFDVETMVYEELVDSITICPRWTANDSDMPIAEWKKEFPNTPIYAGLTDLIFREFTDYETVAGYAAAYLAEGADKIYLYNMFVDPNNPTKDNGAIYQKAHRTFGSLRTLMAEERRCIVTFQDMTPENEQGFWPFPNEFNGFAAPSANGYSMDVLTGSVLANDWVYLVVGVNKEIADTDLTAYVNGHEVAFVDKAVATYGEEYTTYINKHFALNRSYQYYAFYVPASYMKTLDQTVSFTSDDADLQIVYLEFVINEDKVPVDPDYTPDEAVALDKNWKLAHRWSFNGSVVDDIGGITAAIDDVFNTEPGFANGRITLDGSTAYDLSEAIRYEVDDDFKVTIKGSFALNTATGYHFILKGGGQSVLGYSNDQNTYVLDGVTKPAPTNHLIFSPDNSMLRNIWEVDPTTITEEHVIEYMYYNEYNYIYVDGVQVSAFENVNKEPFIFEEMFGNTAQTNANSKGQNAFGSIDYIAISTLTRLPAENAPVLDTDSDPMTYDQAYAADRHWQVLHRFDFDGDVTDSVGGITATLDDLYNVVPTFASGNASTLTGGTYGVGGFTAYKLSKDIKFSATDNFRVTVKGSFDLSGVYGQNYHRILGEENGPSVIGYSNLPAAYAGNDGSSVVFKPSVGGLNATDVYNVEATDLTGAHVTDFLYYDGILYVYVDGVLKGQSTSVNTKDFCFNQLLGDTAGSGSLSANTAGTVDYVTICAFSETELEAAPVFDGDTPYDQAYANTNNWEILHRWDFDGDVKDSVGGITATQDEDYYTAAPTFANGKITVGGRTTYRLSKDITFAATDNFRITVKGSFLIAGAYGEGYHNILGGSGTNSRFGYCNYNKSNVATYPEQNSWVLSPQDNPFNYIHPVADGNITDEHVIDLLHFDGIIYLYVDGTLVSQTATVNTTSFLFNTLLGSTTATGTLSTNVAGTVDYLVISTYSKTASAEPPVFDNDVVITPESILNSDKWQNLHAWEFEGDVTDSIGGVTATLDDVYNTAPTFENGKIVLSPDDTTQGLGGRTVYHLSKDITFAASDNFRISVKGRYFLRGANGEGIHYFLHNASGSSQVGYVYFYSIPNYGDGSVLTIKGEAEGLTLYDVAATDLTEEHVIDFMYYKNTFYIFVDGTLVAESTIANTADFCFDTMFGNANGTGSLSNNVAGTVDYVRIAKLGE